MTICHQWAWKPNDTMKSLEQCVRTLLLTNGGDGNLLFNVGPQPDGLIEAAPGRTPARKWAPGWTSNAVAIYGTRGGPYKPGKALASTRKGNKIFLHVMKWSGDAITVPALPKKVLSARLLDSGKTLDAVEADGAGSRSPWRRPTAIRWRRSSN